MYTKKRYKVKSRLRFTVFIAVALLLTLTSVNGVLGIYDAESLTKVEYQTVEIKPGDTLWEIAAEYMSDTEIRQAVHQLCELNETDAAQLQPGQVIKVPVSVV